MYDGENLAKVLQFYNLLPDNCSSSQKIICPFHDDARPSMLVDLIRGSWYCFGCARSGDARSFVRQMNPDLNDLQALSIYQKIVSSNSVRGINIKREPKPTRRCMKQLYDEAYDYYHGLSKIDWTSQGNTKEALDALQYMRQRGFTADTLTRCKAKVSYNKNYGLIFPMLDNGVFKGWVCRTLIKEVEQERKYLYNKGFRRRSTLVGNYGVLDYVFIVEGYMDYLKFIQYGIENVVAILGWKMSVEQEEKLKRSGVKFIISALDNDECGKKGTAYLKTKFEVVRFQYLKKVKDPGEMTPELFKKMYSRTMQKVNLFLKEQEKKNGISR